MRGRYDLLFASVGGYTEAPLPLRHARTRSAYYCHEPMRLLYEPRGATPIRHAGAGLLDTRLLRHAHQALGPRRARARPRPSSPTRATAASTPRACYGVDAAVNYPGVDTDAFRPGDEDRERFVLTVGELLPDKGLRLGDPRSRRHPGSKAPAARVGRQPITAGRGGVSALSARRCTACGSICVSVHRTPNSRGCFGPLQHSSSPRTWSRSGWRQSRRWPAARPSSRYVRQARRETVVDGETGFLCTRDPARTRARR